MFPNYFSRMPVYSPMNNPMNSPIGTNNMMGFPPDEDEADVNKAAEGADTTKAVEGVDIQTDPSPVSGTGGPSLQFEPGPSVQTDINYTQGYLQTKIGRYVKIDFLIGTNLFIDREGILEKVGISYVVIRESGTGNELMCDIYSIKFVEIFGENKFPKR